jgi:hypothetical protein
MEAGLHWRPDSCLSIIHPICIDSELKHNILTRTNIYSMYVRILPIFRGHQKWSSVVYIFVLLLISPFKICLEALAQYGVRSQKLIWALCALMYSLAETPQPPTPPHLGSYTRATLPIGQTSLCDPLPQRLCLRMYYCTPGFQVFKLCFQIFWIYGNHN